MGVRKRIILRKILGLGSVHKLLSYDSTWNGCVPHANFTNKKSIL